MRGNLDYQDYFRKMIGLVRTVPGCRPHAEMEPDEPDGLAVKDRDIYRQDIAWLERCQCVIAEVSGASLGVGYEIAYALHVLKLRVLALSHADSGPCSAMIAGNSSPLMTFHRYRNVREMEALVRGFLESCQKC